MSRSYRKNPIVKDSGCKKFIKRYSNKKVRKRKCIKNGKMYMKIYNSWNINDCFFRCTYNEWKFTFYYNNIKIGKKNIDKDEYGKELKRYMRYWFKIYYWK